MSIAKRANTAPDATSDALDVRSVVVGAALLAAGLLFTVHAHNHSHAHEHGHEHGHEHADDSGHDHHHHGFVLLDHGDHHHLAEHAHEADEDTHDCDHDHDCRHETDRPVATMSRVGVSVPPSNIVLATVAPQLTANAGAVGFKGAPPGTVPHIPLGRFCARDARMRI